MNKVNKPSLAFTAWVPTAGGGCMPALISTEDKG